MPNSYHHIADRKTCMGYVLSKEAFSEVLDKLSEGFLFICVPGMALFLLVKVQPWVTYRPCS